MVYLFDASMELDGEENRWYITFPAFPGEIASGKTRQEAAGNAHDLLYLLVSECLDEGEPIPSPCAAEQCNLVIGIDVTEPGIAATKCMTVGEAAEQLGVTPGRVSQLLSSGQLEAYMYGNTRLVTIASVNERKASKPAAHRPRKREAATA